MTVSGDMMDRAMESELTPTAASPLPAARRVLAFAPHADDEVFGCGGTLCRLADAGASIRVVVVSDGALGGKLDGPHVGTLTEERETESRAAAKVLGYPAPIFWRLPDRGVRYGEALVAKVLEAMQAEQPDLVFAPALTELHPDHQALALAAAEALRRLGGERRIAFYEVSAPLAPNTLIDITACEKQKQAAMRCFRSQLAQQPYDERIAALNRYRGYTLGADVKAAEAFFFATATELATGLGLGLTPLFESALGRRRRLGLAVDGADLPLVSVIVRSMDRPTLAQALASVAAQTYPNIEVLVVNAKGGRHSPLPDLGDRPAMRLIEKGTPLARSCAANAGLDASRGVYVALLDDDDTLDPDHLGPLVATLRGEGDGVVAYSGVRCMDRNDPEHKISRVFGEPFESRAKLLAGNFIPSHAVLLPRRLVENGVRFDEALAVYEDWDFWLQLSEVARFVYLDRVTATYFTGGTSAISPLAFDPDAVREAARALFAKWRERITPEELKAMGDLYHGCKAELLGTQGEVRRLVDRVWETEARLDDTQARLEKNRDVLASTEAVLAHTEQVLASTRDTLEIQGRDVATLVAALDALRNSNSWKLSAPLRWIGRQRRRAGMLWRALPAGASQVGGWRKPGPLGLKAWNRKGWAGIAAWLNRQMAPASPDPGAGPIPETPEAPAPRATAARAPVPGREILFVSHDASRTGAPIFLLSLIDYLAGRLDMNCTILLASGGALESEFRKLGTTIVLGSRSELDPLLLRKLKGRNIGLVYSSTITNGALQVRLKALGCPIVCHVHELAYSIEHFFGDRNLKQVLESTDLFLAGSKAVAGYLEKRVPKDRVALAYPFIDTEANRRAAARALPPLDLPEGTFVVGACGTISWRKGTDLFVQLARRVLAATAKPVMFVWLGGPLDQGEYQHLRYDAQVMGIDDRLVFTGVVDSHLPYFNQFDIFVLPSREDPFPLVMLDAASLGKPLVCFAHAGGAPELVESDAGLIVPYMDLDAMAAAVLKLMEDPELRATLGEGARRKTWERHDRTVGGEHIAGTVEEFLTLTLARKAS